jgi:hypothetical protein
MQMIRISQEREDSILEVLHKNNMLMEEGRWA